MSGSNPKYLPIPKKIPYNIRMPKPLLDKLNAYAELTDNTTTDIVIGALNDFIKDKVVFNEYLPNINGVTVEIPILSNEKSDFYNTNIIGGNANELYNELSGYSATTDAYEILKIPNNLDEFDSAFGYVTPGDNVIGKGKHSGIEFVIIPEIYTAYYDNDIIDTLYCLYFEVEVDKLKSVKLIDYIDAINKANDVGNVDLKTKLTLCVNELNELNSALESYDGYDDVALTDGAVGGLTKIAEKYNTGNIIKLGDAIGESAVISELSNNPGYINGIIHDELETIVGDTLDAIIDAKVDEIFDKKLDELETATDEMNVKLDKINDSIKKYLE